MPNLFVDTITGLPVAASDTAKRFLAGGIFGKGNIFDLREPAPKTYKSALEQGIASRAENLRNQFSRENMVENAMNFSPMGMASVSKTVAPKVFKGFKDLSTRILEDLKGRSTVSKQYISDLTNQGALKQAERDIVRNVLDAHPDVVDVNKFAGDVKNELLPLKVRDREITSGGGSRNIGRYENITLPDEIKGDVMNYGERIYESPIKTGAGDVHFGHLDKDVGGYFGHTRIEDMADNKTRRVIEVQSDLYQKGNLENELLSEKTKYGYAREFAKNKEIDLADKKSSRAKEMSKLQQYNDPTAHFRMVREEIKKASQDGKTKLQFPTGETAMKIEGLGVENNWHYATTGDRILPNSNLKVGNELLQGIGPRSDSWIITDVLGDGKFKAISKKDLIHDAAAYKSGKSESMIVGGNKMYYRNADIETFDISGKVDTNNPIYRFYEKDLGRYLQKFGGQTVTDSKGVTWNELPITKEMANKPVLAFGKSTIGTILGSAGAATAGVSLFSSNKTHYEAPKKEEMSIYKIKDRPVEVKDDEIKDLGAVAFGEAGNNIDEIRMVMNVAINRANQGNGDVFKELSKKGKSRPEFQAYGGKQYNDFMTDNLDFVSKKKAALVNQVLNEIKNGTLVDNTDGATYFSHGDDGKLRTFKNLFDNINHSR